MSNANCAKAAFCYWSVNSKKSQMDSRYRIKSGTGPAGMTDHQHSIVIPAGIQKKAQHMIYLALAKMSAQTFCLCEIRIADKR
jgi:hypothetical protein